MRNTLTAVAIVLFSLCAEAAPTTVPAGAWVPKESAPPEVAKLLAVQKELAPKAMAAAKVRVQAARESLAKARISSKSDIRVTVQDRKADLDAATQHQSNITKGYDLSFPTIYIDSEADHGLFKGEIGLIDQEVQVDTVVDSNTVQCSVKWEEQHLQTGYTSGYFHFVILGLDATTWGVTRRVAIPMHFTTANVKGKDGALHKLPAAEVFDINKYADYRPKR